MTTIKPIETVYNGYRFRSRLEARWAVFLDKLGIKYQYEKDGFNLDGIWYLPDLWLSEFDCWYEIKGQSPNEEELKKAYKLAVASQKAVFVFGGECWHETCGYEFIPATVSPSYIWRMHVKMAESLKYRYCMSKQSEPPEGIWLSDNEYMGINRPEDWPSDQLFHYRYGLNTKDKIYWSYPVHWITCLECNKTRINSTLYSCGCSGLTGIHRQNTVTPRLIAAYTAARQARFEHGESGLR